MKICVISDTHGDVKGFKKALKILKGAQYILHAGDILNHGPYNPILPTYDPLRLAEELNRSPVPPIFAKGNCDSEVDNLALEYPIQNPYAFVFLEDFKIMVNHGDTLTQGELLKLAKKYRLNMVITGHTHIYQLQEKEGIIFLNPGSPSLPKEDKIPTVAQIILPNVGAPHQSAGSVRPKEVKVEIIEINQGQMILGKSFKR